VLGVELTIMAVMIAANSFFAAYEIALASVSLARLDFLVREHRRGAAAAARMKGNMEASLAVVQLGITLVGTIAAATGGAGAEESLEPILKGYGFSPGWAQLISMALIVIPLTIITIICGELVPKVFALRNKEFVCLVLSPLMEWFALVTWPAVWAFENSVSFLVRFGERMWQKRGGAGPSEPTDTALQELGAIAALARTSRLIGVREEGIILNAVRLSRTPVRTAMLPADYISMLNINEPVANCLISAHHDMHTRFPVTEKPDDPDGIVGYANFKDLVACLRLAPLEASLKGILRPIPSIQEDVSMAAVLERLIHEHQHIALVRNTQGHVVGMITMEDILEELLGEIHDEFDRLPGHVMPAGRSWVVGGGTTLAHLKESTGIELAPPPTEPGVKPAVTLNEWIRLKLARPADGGEMFDDGDVSFLVRKVRRNLVQEVQITRKPKAPPPTNGDGSTLSDP
jgi:putative hemolysin